MEGLGYDQLLLFLWISIHVPCIAWCTLVFCNRCSFPTRPCLLSQFWQVLQSFLFQRFSLFRKLRDRFVCLWSVAWIRLFCYIYWLLFYSCFRFLGFWGLGDLLPSCLLLCWRMLGITGCRNIFRLRTWLVINMFWIFCRFASFHYFVGFFITMYWRKARRRLDVWSRGLITW